jgi:hypothetical protein
MTAKELLDKINEETILQISMPEVAIRIINEVKTEWCKQQRGESWANFRRALAKANIQFMPETYRMFEDFICNAPEP